MAGHSKWANIKHKKERADAKKGKVFSKIAKEIISAVKQGGPDVKANFRLRLAIQKAKNANVPSEVIERNIKKAANSDQSDFFEVTYEIYGHGGVGILVNALTDNKNRTASDMRIATNKNGGALASPGSVMFNFEKKGIFYIAIDRSNETDLFNVSIDSGADDFESTPEGFIVYCDPVKFFQAKEFIENSGIIISDANIEMLPKSVVACDQKVIDSNDKLISFLEDLDDVNSVYHNMVPRK